MKRIVFLFLAAVLTASSVMAQMDKIGVQAGLNISSYWGRDLLESKAKPGIQLGVVTESEFIKLHNFSGQAGLLFVQMGGKVVDLNKDKLELALNYLQIPVYIRYNIDLGGGLGLFLQAGGYTGLAISGKEKYDVKGKTESKKIKFKDRNMQRFDVGVGFGAGLRVTNNIQVGFANNWGFSSLIKDSPVLVNWYNSHFALTATYMFGK